MGRRGQSITLSISDRDKEQLEAFALEFGMTWGDKPNISGLLKAIAERKLLIAANHDWKEERIAALEQARKSLVDLGRNNEAMTIAQLLLDRTELKIPLRKELEAFAAKQSPNWRAWVDRYINRQQPFKLSYQDARDRFWTYTVCFAQIVARDEREYLDCWCEENNQGDIPELQHNWSSLRIDRIIDAEVIEIDRSWRSGLDTISVEFHLFDKLAGAYRSKKNEDEVNEWLDESMTVKRVVRSVSSPFWFKREIFRYGKDCEVISPQIVRDAIVLEIKTMQQRYKCDAHK